MSLKNWFILSSQRDGKNSLSESRIVNQKKTIKCFLLTFTDKFNVKFYYLSLLELFLALKILNVNRYNLINGSNILRKLVKLLLNVDNKEVEELYCMLSLMDNF